MEKTILSHLNFQIQSVQDSANCSVWVATQSFQTRSGLEAVGLWPWYLILLVHCAVNLVSFGAAVDNLERRASDLTLVTYKLLGHDLGGSAKMEFQSVETLATLGFRMPAEWEPHDGCWMGWPERPDMWWGNATYAQKTCVEVATAIGRFEPVTIIVTPKEWPKARQMLPREIRVVEASCNDPWLRDIGPTFVVRDAVSSLDGCRSELLPPRCKPHWAYSCLFHWSIPFCCVWPFLPLSMFIVSH